MFAVLNVTDEDQWVKVWDEAEAWLGDKVDVLMNNAGVFSRSNWRPMNDINMTGLLIGTYLAIQRMGLTQGRGNRGGTVVQTASLAGLLTTGWTSHTEYTYTATKHAVVALTRGLNDKTCSTWREDRVARRDLSWRISPWLVRRVSSASTWARLGGTSGDTAGGEVGEAREGGEGGEGEDLPHDDWCIQTQDSLYWSK